MTKYIFAIMMFLVFSTVSYADTPSNNNQTQTAQTSSITPDSARKWAGVGKDIADGISATAHGLNVEVNNFVTTPVGILSICLLLWYMIGYTIFKAFLLCAIWAAIGSVMWKSFRTFHIPRIEIDDKGIKREIYYSFRNGESRAVSACAHVFIFSVFSLIILLNVI